MIKKIIIIVLVCVFAFLLITYPLHFCKTPLHEATIEQFQEVRDIGPILSMNIMIYVRDNPECIVDDLDDVKYIGETKLDNLRERFR